MADVDMRRHEIFFGIYTVHWDEDFPDKFEDHHYLLTQDYINEDCTFISNSSITETLEFFYPHFITRVMFIEGVVKGQITIGCHGASDTVERFRVSVYKVSNDEPSMDMFLCGTGWKTVNAALAWDGAHNVGEEVVFAFWIDVKTRQRVGENERIYLRVEAESTGDDCVIWHDNDATYEDIKIDIPLKM